MSEKKDISFGFSEEELNKIVSSITGAPANGYESIAKNRAIYTTAFKRLANAVAEKIAEAILSIGNGTEGEQSKKVSKEGDTMSGPLAVENIRAFIRTILSFDGLHIGGIDDESGETQYGKDFISVRRALNEDWGDGEDEHFFGLPQNSGTLVTEEKVRSLFLEEFSKIDFIKPVKERPAVGEPNCIYLVPTGSDDEENLFEMWLWVNKGTEENPDFGWEFEGSKKIDADFADFVKKTDYATSKTAGVLKCDRGYGITVDEYGRGKIVKAEKSDISDKSNTHNPIVPAMQDYAWKESAINNKETWTDLEKCTVREFIGAERPTVAVFKFEEGDNLTIKIDGISGKYKIDWGDGSSSKASGTTENGAISHTYPSAGTYTCTLRGIISLGEGAFLNNTNLHSIEFSNAISVLGNFVFRGCGNLKTVKLSNSLKTLGNGHFYGCTSLKQIIIPANINDIGNSAFYKCTSLECIEFENAIPVPYKADMFKSCNALARIIVPYTSVDAYKEQWTEMADKIDRIAYKNEFPQELMFGYRQIEGKHTIKRNGYYMCFSSNNDLRLCKKDGTVVVEGAKQIQFMASPFVDEPSAEQFNVSGMYWTGALLSGVEGFRRTTDDGGYITGDSTFYIAQMVKE